ncbi:MAG: nitroreductase/quinone reductase family protein [Ornithinibacter sp.]
MSFDNPQGTRGARQPAGPVTAFVNRLMAKVAGRRGSMMGMDVLTLTTIGRRTGEERTTPLARFSDPQGAVLVVASAAGALGNPAWYHNLAANPDRVRMEIDGRVTYVAAEQLHGQERAAAWERITAAMPRFSGYQEKTDREIPVIRLVPRTA